MARPREFDAGEAIEKAMQVFLEKGHGAALPDLLDGKEIARGSFYKAFSDKKSVYLMTLAHYDRKVLAPAIAGLRDAGEPDGRKRIERLLHAAAGSACAGDRRGCFLWNTAASAAMEDPDIAREVLAMIARLAAGYLSAARAIPSPEPRGESEIAAIAAAAMAAYIGLTVIAKAGASAGTLERVVSGALGKL
jgi:TetR/AcrR family transcriptional repressor of nem operon